MEWEPNGSIANGGGHTPASAAIFSGSDTKRPFLEIVVKPQPKFRFRYKSEMTGKHGSLVGVLPNTGTRPATPPSPSANGPKLYPTVKLHNYFGGPVIIRCSLVSDTPPHFPHPHILDMALGQASGGGGTQVPPAQVQVTVGPDNDYTAVFPGLNIIYCGKKSMRKELEDKLAALHPADPRRFLSQERLDELALGINLNAVSLYFEAFGRGPGPDSPYQLIAPPVLSQPIQHNKSTQTSELRIVRIDKHTSVCTGDEEVFLLVEKVDKHNIQVKFFLENEKGVEIWKAYGRFSKLDVHHQYAIVFKTPAYRFADIESEVEVWLQLERPADGATSQPIPFKYKPVDRLRKMPRRQKFPNEPVGVVPILPSEPSVFQPPAQQPQNQLSNPASSPTNPTASTGTSSCSRQGRQVMFPCDLSALNTAAQANREKLSKSLALNVALSVGESLHTWAETSDFNFVLQKLRHLLCLVNENGDNALHTAILNQQREPFTRILNTISSSTDIRSIINEPNLQSLTPLSVAVLANSEDFVDQLLHHGADLSVSTFEGDTPLHLAVKARSIECLKRLLACPRASDVINRFNYNSMTPLHLAVSEGSLECIELLCNSKANAGCQEGTYGRTALHMAVERGSFTSALLMLKAAEETEVVNVQNYRGDTPLHCAVSAETPSPALVALLLYFGADSFIENYIGKDCDEGEVEAGHGRTVFDLANTDEILKLLNGRTEDWERLLKMTFARIESECEGDREKVLSSEFHSLHFDSGIDIKDASSSTFTN